MRTASTPCVIAVDDPARDDVRALVHAHRVWSLQQTPAQFSFSVDAADVADSGITLLSARSPDGALVGIGGLKELDRRHGEIKTMHTAVEARGQRIGRALLEALLVEARRRGYTRVSLETGTGATFAAARRLYESVGFRPGGPFGGYADTDYNVCMTMRLGAVDPADG